MTSIAFSIHFPFTRIWLFLSPKQRLTVCSTYFATQENRVVSNKSMVDDGVYLNESMDDNGVDFDKSMDDEEVDLCRTMDNDFNLISVTGALKLSYDDLVSATNNFSENEQLGKGGFGAVYKGFLKELNCYVAVKRVSRDSKQGIKEYASEVKIITQFRHENIVQLMGWCHERKELILVYEFMANGSLDSHLFKEKSLLAWEERYKIARGLAAGLLYLHEGREQYVVHRDIKASNIMLHSSFNAKLGDFGLARLGDHGKVLANTPLAGTVGYVAPEYATTGRASKESDVYSFGIVLLEIACGRRVIDRKAMREDQMSLRDWVWDLFGERKLLEAVDPRLSTEFDKQQVKCLMIVGLWCAHPDAMLRPTIGKAIHVLNFEDPLPDLPSKMPVFSFFGSLSTSSSDTKFVGVKKGSPRIGYNDLVRTKQEGSFGSMHERFLRVLTSGFLRSKGKKKVSDLEIDSGIPKFSYEDLVRATSNFSEGMRVGHEIYRGFSEELDSYVAVKRMVILHDRHLEAFASKVNIISRLKHKNLVQLIGVCHERKELFLVYEFMSSDSLDSHLFNEDRVLKWELRYKIAQDLAWGLLHMHEEWEECVVHNNLTSSTVMLDSDFNAKLLVSCFARLSSQCQNHGYPYGKNSERCCKEFDVYSFGNVALEIACGRKRYTLDGLLDEWVWDRYARGNILEAVDPRLNGDFDAQQVEILMIVGLWCTRSEPGLRPSIRQATQVLNFGAPSPLMLLRPSNPLPLYWSMVESQNQISETTALLIGR